MPGLPHKRTFSTRDAQRGGLPADGENIDGVVERMMTYAWTLTLCFDENLKPVVRGITRNYILALVKQLTPEQALYAETRWRDPI
jgi:hypothetical protein